MGDNTLATGNGEGGALPDTGTILIIDDNPGNLRVLGAIIEQAGYGTRATLSGETALRWLADHTPDLILLDVRMPDMDGYETCRRIKSRPSARHIPVIFISALHDAEDKLRAFDEGGVDYITKPFNAGEVIARVKAHVELAGARRALEEANRALEERVAERPRELETAKARAEHLAYHDALTGLANRRLFEDRLSRELRRVSRHGGGGGVLFIDLDHFKAINDALGHAVGDAYLKALADVMKDILRDEDTLSRWGGDEFVVLLPALGGDAGEAAASAGLVANKLANVIATPVSVEGNEVQAGASIGVVLYPGDGQTVDDIIGRADTAMYAAKQAGRGTVQFFEPRIQAIAEARYDLEHDLCRALERDELFLVYEPRVDIRGRVVGMEAVAQWRHPRRGVLGPGEFMPVAEDSGIVHSLMEWWLQAALAQPVRWQAFKIPGGVVPRLAVTIPPGPVDKGDFVERLAGLMKDAQAAPEAVEIQVTQDVLALDEVLVGAVMGRLYEAGVSLTVAGFGSGCSSLELLGRLPIQGLSMSAGVVRGIADDAAHGSLARAIIAMARTLGLGVLATAVETEAERAFLVAQGCEYFQGTLVGPPLAADELSAYLEGAGEGRRV
ncbi:MAG: diguanylate cyclase [Gammaproteobacteria bacterium]|nr:diguanylate cyclase [Gammaproteobacteria bacterium]